MEKFPDRRSSYGESGAILHKQCADLYSGSAFTQQKEKMCVCPAIFYPQTISLLCLEMRLPLSCAYTEKILRRGLSLTYFLNRSEQRHLRTDAATRKECT
jgi:hypothetical protein